MRSRFFRSGALVVLACASPMLTRALMTAQEPPDTQPAQRVLPRRHHPGVGDHVEFLAKYLDLTGSQRSLLTSILAQRQQEILAMRSAHSEPNVPPGDMFRAIEDKTAERIRAVLNQEQRKKYDPLGTRNSRPAPQQQSVEDWLKAARPR